MSESSKLKIYISEKEKLYIDVIGKHYQSLGLDGYVNDKGQVNRSAVIRSLIEFKIQELDEE